MRILVVEDNDGLRSMLQYHLQQAGFAVDACADGEDGLHWARQQAHDLILLDRMLPKLDGLALLHTLRKENIQTPVLMVTALGTVDNRVQGLDAGADDYLAKPFAVEELLARVRAMCRRPRAVQTQDTLQAGDISFDPLQKRLSGTAGSCRLSTRETALLEVFLRNPGAVLTRDVLLSRVWGPDAGVEDGNLDSYVHFLRAHLREVGGTLRVKTVRGVGYTLEIPDV